MIELKPGLHFTQQSLKRLLPDVETALFFAQLYELDAKQLGVLLHKLFNSTLTSALFAEGEQHSSDLQDYLVDLCEQIPGVDAGDLKLDSEVIPKGEILPEVWASLEVEIASSIKEVAAKLADVITAMPGKQGEMMFTSMKVLNKKRPVIGDYRVRVHHPRQAENLVILDVSGSVNSNTVQAIVEDVVAMAYMANAHFAIVSNSCTHWEPGTYGVDDILRAAEYGGTHYERLAPLFDRNWGTVVTIADYDSSAGAKDRLAKCVGVIDEVLDLSLVDQPTYLAQCVGQLAKRVRPILMATTSYPVGTYGY